MGTGSRSDVASITLGSVSHRVLHHSHRPILLVPGSE
jgi:nucleotide-binding universal stress UspA family protein